MIKVSRFYNTNHELIGLELKGHSDLGEYGSDIVCSAVSLAFIGSVNALEKIEDYQPISESGYGFIKCQTEVTNHDKIVLEVLESQLLEVNKNYPLNLKFIK